jgi:hypothetical protein
MYGRRSLLYGSEVLLHPVKAVAQSRDVFFYLAKDDRDFSLPAHQLLQSALYQFHNVLSHSGLPLLVDECWIKHRQDEFQDSAKLPAGKRPLGTLPLISPPISEALAFDATQRGVGAGRVRDAAGV